MPANKSLERTPQPRCSAQPLDLMKSLAVVFFLTASLSAASAETFDARVQRAKTLEDTPLGKAYQDSMWPVVQPFMMSLLKECISHDATADLTSFVWVATPDLRGNG